MSVEQKRALISQSSKLSLRSQCTLLGLSRSTQYYKAHKPPDETDWMNLIADIYGRRLLNRVQKLPPKWVKSRSKFTPL